MSLLKDQLPRNREEIRAIYAQGEEAVVNFIEQLINTIIALEARVESLENHLSKTSRNSSKPPSKDGFKKRTKSLRPQSNRPSGGQPGHPGSTLEWSECIDHQEEHSPVQCENCGASVLEVEVHRMEHRQVYDIPPLHLEITEHQCHEKICPECGCLNRGVFPAHVSAPVQYGPRLKGFLVYLMTEQLLPSGRAMQLMEDLWDCGLSEGTLYTARTDCYERLEPVEASIASALRQAPVEHFDETSLRVCPQSMWLHVACTETLTHYGIHSRRGREAMAEIGILPEFTGVAVHDGLSSYWAYGSGHGLCNAHHLRDLVFIVERYHQQWADKMIALLLAIKAQVEQAKAQGLQGLKRPQLVRFEKRYQGLINRGLKDNPQPPEDSNEPKKRGRPKQTPPKNLLDRLKEHQKEVLAFMYDFRVPFDNNQAERDLRMMKLKDKISGCFRSMQGAKEFCRIRGYISTLKKQGMKVLDALTQVFIGQPIYPASCPE